MAVTVIIDPNVNGTDFVTNGELHMGIEYSGNVLVGSSDDLTDIAEYYKPGAMAHTAGWASVWELSEDGSSWEDM